MPAGSSEAQEPKSKTWLWPALVTGCTVAWVVLLTITLVGAEYGHPQFDHAVLLVIALALATITVLVVQGRIHEADRRSATDLVAAVEEINATITDLHEKLGEVQAKQQALQEVFSLGAEWASAAGSSGHAPLKAVPR
jgi:uncharacterized membrane protein